MEPSKERLMRLPEIIGNQKHGIPGRLPMSKSKWYAGIEAGIFPAPVHIGRGSYWQESAVIEVIEQAVMAPKLLQLRPKTAVNRVEDTLKMIEHGEYREAA